MTVLQVFFSFFFFNDTATTEIYTLSLHDALPISGESVGRHGGGGQHPPAGVPARYGPAHRSLRPTRHCAPRAGKDRKSTRLNSSHLVISYAVFCLKKKKKHHTIS